MCGLPARPTASARSRRARLGARPGAARSAIRPRAPSARPWPGSRRGSARARGPGRRSRPHPTPGRAGSPAQPGPARAPVGRARSWSALTWPARPERATRSATSDASCSSSGGRSASGEATRPVEVPGGAAVAARWSAARRGRSRTAAARPRRAARRTAPGTCARPGRPGRPAGRRRLAGASVARRARRRRERAGVGGQRRQQRRGQLEPSGDPPQQVIAQHARRQLGRAPAAARPARGRVPRRSTMSARSRIRST